MVKVVVSEVRELGGVKEKGDMGGMLGGVVGVVGEDRRVVEREEEVGVIGVGEGREWELGDMEGGGIDGREDRGSVWCWLVSIGCVWFEGVGVGF